MLVQVANLITLSAYTHIYSNNISSNPICLLAPHLHAWPNWEPSCSCCFSSCSLPQRLVAIWPARSCYWNLGVVSLLLVSLKLNLLLSPCVPPRPLFFPLCFWGEAQFWGLSGCFLSCLRGACPGHCWLWKVLWRGTARWCLSGEHIAYSLWLTVLLQHFKKGSKVLATAQVLREKCAFCLSGGLFLGPSHWCKRGSHGSGLQ